MAPNQKNCPLSGLHFINSTEKEAIRKGWENISLTLGVDFDDSIFEEPDNEVELLLQDRLNELMLEDNSEDDDVEVVLNAFEANVLVANVLEEVAIVPNVSGVNEMNSGVSGQIALLPAEPESNQQKKRKQSQITDFFELKNKF